MFFPQTHRPGEEAEVDFGEVEINMWGTSLPMTRACPPDCPKQKQFSEVCPHLDGAGVIDAVGAGGDPGRRTGVAVHGHREAPDRHRRRAWRPRRQGGARGKVLVGVSPAP